VGPSIVLEPPLDHRRSWTRAAGDTRRRIAELTDVDACTRLEIEAVVDDVQVRASAADGRTVVRAVSKPSELEATVVALLVLPPAEREQESTARAQSGETKAADASTAPTATPKPPVVPLSAKPLPRKPETPDDRDRGARLPNAGTDGGAHAFELALGGSGRSTGYLFGPGLSGVVDWNLSGWLLGAGVHAEEVSGPSGASGRFSAEHSASIGALFGRRLVTRPFFVDVALEAPVLALRTSRWTSQALVTVPGQSESDDASGTDTDDVLSTSTSSRAQATAPNLDLRAGGLLRAGVPFAGRFGATLALDGERSLGLLRATSAAGEPAALVWNYGLSLGLFWSGG